MTFRIPSGKWSATLLGKSFATRGPQEVQRTKTQGLNSIPVEPEVETQFAFVCTRRPNVIENASACDLCGDLFHPRPYHGSKTCVRCRYWSHVHSTTKYLVVQCTSNFTEKASKAFFAGNLFFLGSNFQGGKKQCFQLQNCQKIVSKSWKY